MKKKRTWNPCATHGLFTLWYCKRKGRTVYCYMNEGEEPRDDQFGHSSIWNALRHNGGTDEEQILSET